MEIYDFLKVILGAALTICGQWIYVNLNTKKDKNKLKRQKLEEAFIIIGDILGGMSKKWMLLINPNFNIEDTKFEIGKLHLLISFYAPELQEDYKDFMATYQEFFWLLKERYDIEDNNMEDIKKIVMKFDSLLALFASKGNKIKEKLVTMTEKL
ncbi:hypothetical protein [uncultured Campylobacter sp.]|jgi:hypothetical protein|uniref:hypothetical protein n=1 Tax=uncultured Campylobacter sp. TaxID=218934 RepID=UPI0026163F6A|nr:hypothetical protein [uncultured Campylobacter sp.]